MGCNERPIFIKHAKRCDYCKAEARERAKVAMREYTRAKQKEADPDWLRRRQEARARWRAKMAILDRAPGPLPLPAKPLAAAMDAIAERLHRENGDDAPGIQIVCEKTGVQPRLLLRWRIGEIAKVQFEVADRALTALDLLWWEVWDEDRYPVEHAAVAAALNGNGHRG
jgi:hypothetical protein